MSALVDPPPPHASNLVKLRTWLARVNFHTKYGGTSQAVSDLEKVWGPLTEIEDEVKALEAFKKDFHGDPFQLVYDYLQHRLLGPDVLANAIRSAVLVLNKLIALAQSRELEVTVSPHVSGIGLGVSVYHRVLLGEVRADRTDKDRYGDES